MKKYITEFLGTFFLMFTIVWVVHSELIPQIWKPTTIGLVLMVLIYVGGPISKAHYNPAATIGFITRRQMDSRDILPYFMAELLGAFLAAVIGAALFANSAATPFVVPDLSMALIAEFLGTFVIVSVIMYVATLKKTIGNKYYGFAIALAVVLMIHAFGHLSGGAFNPAVALGFVSTSMVDFKLFALVVAVCMLSGWLSGMLFNALEAKLGDSK
ncbi:MAG: porin [Flavobacteriales bacterium]|nr:porin [Flavobacteriales bacterium]